MQIEARLKDLLGLQTYWDNMYVENIPVQQERRQVLLHTFIHRDHGSCLTQVGSSL